MNWTKRELSNEDVNRRVKEYLVLLRGTPKLAEWGLEDWEIYESCMYAINHWRSLHAYPLNILQMHLRRGAARVDENPLIAQRTKRRQSIMLKLIGRPQMKLTQMQDVGGCRAVVKSLAAVVELDQFYKTVSRSKHQCVKRDDYISQPQSSGYRGIHLVYRFFSAKEAGAHYNGLKIEMQLRSKYQHAWATAVETVGTFLGDNLKGGIGSSDWLRFFQLMGSVIARRERAPVVPGTWGDPVTLRDELAELAHRLNVENRLIGYTNALERIEFALENAYYYLLKLNTATQPTQLEVTGFRLDQQEEAQGAYASTESENKDVLGMDIVLVSVPSIDDLRGAYPNYFADTRIFIGLLRQALSGHQRRIFAGALKLPLTPKS